MEEPISAPWSRMTELHQGQVRLDTRKMSFPWGWSNTGTVSLARRLILCSCWCSRGVWTMPLIMCFNFWSALQRSGSWARWHLWVPCNWPTLFWPGLFYSIPFYSSWRLKISVSKRRCSLCHSRLHLASWKHKQLLPTCHAPWHSSCARKQQLDEHAKEKQDEKEG